MIDSIKTYCDNLTQNYDTISIGRKIVLEKISAYIKEKQKQAKPIRLMYVCTHNSRRSHFGQVWAKVAAHYFAIQNISTFSGGTEATAFNNNAINALKRIGFKITANDQTINPHYQVVFSEETEAIVCFSKVYNDTTNPSHEFVAIMTCGDAEENCPFITGTELRIATTYNDPKAFDNTIQQDETYDQRCKQIATEIFYMFSKLNQNVS